MCENCSELYKPLMPTPMNLKPHDHRAYLLDFIFSGIIASDGVIPILPQGHKKSQLYTDFIPNDTLILCDSLTVFTIIAISETKLFCYFVGITF